MRWTPGVIVDVAERAGWKGAALTDAVAVALATSGGDDRYHLWVGTPPTSDRRGWWGIDTLAYPQLAGLDLYDPAVNAAAAHALYVAAGDSFDWSPVFRAGIMVRDRQRAAEAVASPVRTMTATEAVYAAGISAHASQLAETERLTRSLLDAHDTIRRRLADTGR